MPRGVGMGYGDGGMPRTAAGSPEEVLSGLLDDPEHGAGPAWALCMNIGLSCAVPMVPVLYGLSRI